MTVEDAFKRTVAPAGRRATWSMLGFVAAWRALVDEVDDGYVGDLDEYQAELSVRDDIERAMADSELASMSAWNSIREEVQASDDRFRNLLGPVIRDGADWWRARLPARGGGELADDARRLFGVDIEVADD